METTVSVNKPNPNEWGGGEGKKPFGATYGKMMMWYFILSDALTFSGFLVAYGLTRFKFIESWPIADEVFTHVPFVHGEFPMIYVAIMTFILIISSVTMVLAVDAGHQNKHDKVAWYMFATIVCGIVFVGSQAWEWGTFIKGSYGALKTNDNQIIQFAKFNDKEGRFKQVAISSFASKGPRLDENHVRQNGLWFEEGQKVATYTLNDVKTAFKQDASVMIRIQKTDQATKQKVVLSREESLKIIESSTKVIEGANLKDNEYGHPVFGDLFFFITGFHGFHVTMGIVLNIIIFINVVLGTYRKRGHYEMVEKVGLYWHFVDLVWVFVFTFFYLV